MPKNENRGTRGQSFIEWKFTNSALTPSVSSRGGVGLIIIVMMTVMPLVLASVCVGLVCAPGPIPGTAPA